MERKPPEPSLPRDKQRRGQPLGAEADTPPSRAKRQASAIQASLRSGAPPSPPPLPPSGGPAANVVSAPAPRGLVAGITGMDALIPAPVRFHAIRTDFGRPNSSIRF